MRRSATMPSARHHEQIQPIAHISAACRRGADLLQVFDRPGRGVEGVGPALRHEQFAAGVLERAEVWVDGVD